MSNIADSLRAIAKERRNRRGLCIAWVLLALSLGSLTHAASPSDPLATSVLYLKEVVPRPPSLSSRQPPPENNGLAGAKLGIADNNTTGKFLHHKYNLKAVNVGDSSEAVAAAREWVAKGYGLILADMPTDSLRQLVATLDLPRDALIFNVSDPADSWRISQCTPGLLHTSPSRAMLQDALAQFLVSRRWTKWFILQGQREADRALADAMTRSAKRFGAKIVQRKTWSFDTDLRRTAQRELPLFTQGRDYDVVLVADEIGDVGEFVPYNTYLPRPVAGTAGLTPTAWSPVIEQWGALQLHSRFERLHNRPMTPEDYAAWIAVRAIGEAVTRTGERPSDALYRFMLSPRFELAVFKGRSGSFRAYNGQFRQPIALVHPKALVSQAPIEGFLHPQTELDTLGYDKPEVSCAFGAP